MKLLDLFCGAGGAGAGYHRAGFEVVGVDHEPQKNYPYEFIQMDAFEALDRFGTYFDAIHASPPCQGYSVMQNLGWHKDITYPLLIDPVRDRLDKLKCSYVIENVMGAKLDANYLCGGMFGLRVYRHRLFETNFFWLAPGHPRHTFLQGMPGAPKPRWARQSTSPGPDEWRKWQLQPDAMGIDWMTKNELAQAIPPIYTEYIGNVMRQTLFKAV
jgi:DNA (cytosine-5)-methyltransferase 1